MQHSFIHRLNRILWVVCVTLIVLLAVYVSFGRLLMASVGDYHHRILTELNSRLPFTVEAGQVTGAWRSFSPEIVFTDLRLKIPGGPEQPIELAEGRLALDVLEMVFTGALHISHLQLDQLSLRARIDEDGRLQIVGFNGGGALDEWGKAFLLNMENLTLTNLELLVSLRDGQQRVLNLDLDLQQRGGGRRQLSAILETSVGTRVNALAEGIGNPFRPAAFTGEAYLEVNTSHLGELRALLPPSLPMAVTSGAVDLQVWLAWDQGVPRIEGKVDARELEITDPEGDWQIPLQQVSFGASLVERRGHWTLFASDLMLRKGGHKLILPRVQFDVWGDSMRLRTQDVSISQLNRALVELEFTPQRLEDTFRILQPGGMLSALQLSVADYHNPAPEWSLQANFYELALDSWRGAPGANEASGYVELAPEGGFVILDATDMSLEFPTVYQQPLFYEDIYGTVNINWYEDAVVLSSGLITARGEEGQVQALFGLNIPLAINDVGLEMDLLVGLQNAQAGYRNKYLPYTLNESLLSWLQGSIDEGEIVTGGFAWRGSLRRGLTAARTVQLFFEVGDTRMEYHSDWPAVTGLEGLVLIDDANISIWSEKARLYETDIDFLSAEAWLDPELGMMLEIDARTQGEAHDGMRVIQESPLNTITRAAFSRWRFSGELDTELRLRLNLVKDGAAPEVDLITRLRQAELTIDPGGLVVTDLDGKLAYTSEHGFNAPELVGRLWGEPVQMEVRQQTVGEAYDPATSAITVDFTTAFDMADVRDWLNLDVLGFASGKTQAEVRVLAPPGEAPVITVTSDLQGVSLDLPEPWSSEASELTPLAVEVRLAAGQTLVEMDLQQQLRLHLQLLPGAVRGGSLGFFAEPAPLQPGLMSVKGHLPVLDAGQWQDFLVGRLGLDLAAVTSPASAAPMADSEPAEDSEPAAQGAASSLPQLRIEQLQVDNLQLWGRALGEVEFSLIQAPDQWQLVLESDWLGGDLALARGAGVSQLNISHLDFDGLQAVDLGALEGGDWNLPDMDVVARQLAKGDRPLGELSFALRSPDERLQALDITGNIAGLQLWQDDKNSLIWAAGEASRTWLDAQVHFADLGQTLEQFGYQSILETNEGLFELSLEWPGSPQSFSLAQAQGMVRLDVEEGRFLDAPAGASGALRVVSILNLAEIVSRLSLTHMFETGIPFREVNGEFFLHRGTIEIANLEVEGGSSRFQFSGLATVADTSLDGELVVTLPVANNLPWVAALAVGLPVAAGVFVVSKVFEKQVNQLSSAVYGIEGPWDDPQIKFGHIFDVDTPARAASVDEQFQAVSEQDVIAVPGTDAKTAETGAVALDTEQIAPETLN